MPVFYTPSLRISGMYQGLISPHKLHYTSMVSIIILAGAGRQL